MTNIDRDCDFPADELERWIQDQRPAEPSSAFLDHCLATIPPADTAEPATHLAAAGQRFHQRRLNMKKLRLLGISGALASSVALLFVGSLWLAQPAEAQKAATVLARGAAATPNPTTVHIVAKMRTPPNDNFGFIDVQHDPVTIEAWRQFGSRPKWRLEEPGRVVVMDGATTTQLMRPKTALKIPRPTYDWGPVLRLTNVADLITDELRDALAKGWDMKLTHERSAAGVNKLVVTVHTTSGLPANDYLHNTYLDVADSRRVYRFDAKTQRLTGVEVYFNQPGGELLVLTTERIEYDQPIDPALFVLKLPANVGWMKELERLPDNKKYEQMTPLEAARTFFEACAREDWKEVQKFDTSPLTDDSKKYLGGMTIVHLGKPFQSTAYAGGKGWFVPYEIKLKNGDVHKHNLALRNDNQAHRYEVDGGI